MFVTSIRERKASNMFSNGRLLACFAFVSTFLVCVPAHAQDTGRQRSGRADFPVPRTAEPSDLAKENLNRVAASAAQIREVLVKDAGILVELKGLVAKEATDNGQIVEDSSLTDDAIFEKLEKDVAFRSLATRLLQRYGYLLPSFNPDSNAGKQQEFILKERARRLVQIEAQEDSGSLQPDKNRMNDNQRMERTTGCDPQLDANCRESNATQTPSRNLRQNELPDTEQNLPNQQEQMPQAPSSSRTLRANTGREDSENQLPSYPANSSNLMTMVTDPTRRPQDALGAAGSV